MKGRILGLSAFLLVQASLAGAPAGGGEPNLVLWPVQKDGKTGFMDSAGKLLIPYRYMVCSWQPQRLADGPVAVRIAGAAGYLDFAGREVIRTQCDEAVGFLEHRAAFRVGRKWGFLDPNGRVVVAPRYDSVFAYHEGLAAVCQAGRWGFVDPAGHVVIAPRFADATFFSEGLAPVKDPNGGEGGKWGFIDHSGSAVIPFEFEQPALGFSEELVCLQQAGRTFYLDKDAKVALMLPPGTLGATPFREGLALVKEEADGGTGAPGGRPVCKFRVIDRGGKEAFSFRARHNSLFAEGLVAVEGLNGKDGMAYLDANGRTVLEVPEAIVATPFFDGLSCVYTRDGGSYVNHEGKAVGRLSGVCGLYWQEDMIGVHYEYPHAGIRVSLPHDEIGYQQPADALPILGSWIGTDGASWKWRVVLLAGKVTDANLSPRSLAEASIDDLRGILGASRVDRSRSAEANVNGRPGWRTVSRLERADGNSSMTAVVTSWTVPFDAEKTVMKYATICATPGEDANAALAVSEDFCATVRVIPIRTGPAIEVPVHGGISSIATISSTDKGPAALLPEVNLLLSLPTGFVVRTNPEAKPGDTTAIEACIPDFVRGLAGPQIRLTVERAGESPPKMDQAYAEEVAADMESRLKVLDWRRASARTSTLGGERAIEVAWLAGTEGRRMTHICRKVVFAGRVYSLWLILMGEDVTKALADMERLAAGVRFTQPPPTTQPATAPVSSAGAR